MKTRILLFFSMFAILNLMVFPGQAGPRKAAASAPRANWLAMPQEDAEDLPQFRVTSTTFQNNGTVPSVMVFNGTLGSNCIGGNMSPELKWTKAVQWTKSYAVVTYDVTANFTHWGIYNIPPDVTELPANAGIATASYPQITDDAGNVGYAGPCPPPGIVPNGIHKYLFTVYALDTKLDLPAFPPGYPAPPETLFRAMIGHVIETATITGLFSCDNAPEAGCS
ncbi:MAG: YbhB/YbcL family Raf kinase inhibitor-like protein [Candidatus Acidiferrum sp.]